MLKTFLCKIEDQRRKQGKRYELEYILLFSILAILSGATSYRKIAKFIKVRYEILNEIFKLNWKRRPAYTTVRDIIQNTSGAEFEKSFREYSQELAKSEKKKQVISGDGKVLRGSFDHFKDQKAVQIPGLFSSKTRVKNLRKKGENRYNKKLKLV